jgi:hypothetical protein
MLALAGFTGGGAAAALVAVVLAPKPVAHTGYWWLVIAVLGIITFVLFSISFPRQGQSA